MINKMVNDLYHAHTSERVTKMVAEKIGKDPGKHIDEACSVCGRKSLFQVISVEDGKKIRRCYYCEGLV